MSHTLTKTIQIIIGITFLFFIVYILLLGSQGRYQEDIKHKISQVDDYDYFYSDCEAYFKKLNVTFDIEKVCKELMTISNNSTKQIIDDIEHPSRPESEPKCTSRYDMDC
jgi:hypothetical protein